MKVMAGLGVLLAVLLLACIVWAKPSGVSIKVRPRYSVARFTTVRVEVRVPRSIQNRWLTVRVEGDCGYYRSSSWTLNGGRASVLYDVVWPDLPEGRYVFHADVARADGSHAVATAEGFYGPEAAAGQEE